MSNENKKLKGYVTLQSIVNNVLNDMGIYSQENYERYMQFVIRGYTQLNLFTLNTVEVAYLTISDVNTCDLPEDYINYVKVGVLNNGMVTDIGLNNSISLQRSENCGEPIDTVVAPTTSTTLYYGFEPYYQRNAWTALYGTSGGIHNVSYRIDKEMRLIHVIGSVTVGSQLVLEYLSSGVSLTGNTYIPRQAQESLIAFVHWKRKQHEVGFNNSEIERAKQDFIEEENMLRSFELTPNFSEVYDVLLEGYNQAVKR